MGSSSINVASKFLKFAALAVFCAFSVLIANHYYYIDSYAKKLSSELDMTVFISKNCPDDAKVCGEIGALGFVAVDKYVSSQEAYFKAVEKNPFLKDISVPGDAGAFQSYVKVVPTKLPTDDYLVAARNAVAKVPDVSEVVFDPSRFKEYVQARDTLSFYQTFGLVFIIAVFVFFVVQSSLFIAAKEENARKLVTNFFAYLVAASAGFAGVWGTSVFLQYPLLIDQFAAFFLIPLTAALGIILKD